MILLISSKIILLVVVAVYWLLLTIWLRLVIGTVITRLLSIRINYFSCFLHWLRVDFLRLWRCMIRWVSNCEFLLLQILLRCARNHLQRLARTLLFINIYIDRNELLCKRLTNSTRSCQILTIGESNYLTHLEWYLKYLLLLLFILRFLILFAIFIILVIIHILLLGLMFILLLVGSALLSILVEV